MLGVSDTAFCAAFSADAQLIAVGYDDGVVGVFGAGDGHVVEVIHSTRGPVRALNFGAGDDLAATGFDGATRVWDPYTGQQIDVLADESAPVLATATTPDGRTLATAGADGRVRVWETLPGRLRYRAPSQTVFAALAPAGDSVVTVGTDDVVTLTRLGPRPASRRTRGLHGRGPGPAADGQRRSEDRRAPPGPPARRRRHRPRTPRDARGRHRAGVGRAAAAVRIVRPRRRPRRGAGRGPAHPCLEHGDRAPSKRRLASHPAVVTDVRFSPDGRLVASTDASGRTEIQAADGSRAPVTLAGRTRLADMAFSADGRLLATAASLAGAATVRLWDVRSGRALGAPATGYGAVAAFSADGRWLATESATGSAAIFRVGRAGSRRARGCCPPAWSRTSPSAPPATRSSPTSAASRCTTGGPRARRAVRRCARVLRLRAGGDGAARARRPAGPPPPARTDRRGDGLCVRRLRSTRPSTRVARSLLVRGLTADETRRYVNGA